MPTHAAPLAPFLLLACAGNAPVPAAPADDAVPPTPRAFAIAAEPPRERPGAVPAPEGCFPAAFTTPCGVSAWTIDLPEGPHTFRVHGPGAPHRGLGLDVLQAPGNRWFVCGRVAGATVDAECGTMPVFEATSFRVVEPVRRLACADFFADCVQPDGSLATRVGPPTLTAEDDQCGPGCALRCDDAGCRFVDG